MKHIGSFRYSWLENFFVYGSSNRRIPLDIESSLARKLDIVNAAMDFRDLRSPPGNRFESLEPPLAGYFSIRINNQYRLIFKWQEGKAEDLYLGPHKYKRC